MANQNKLKILYNPSSLSFNISFPRDMKNVDFSMYTISGKLITRLNTGGSNEARWDVSGVGEGVFVLQASGQAAPFQRIIRIVK